jgi:hypothetical protein
MSAGKVLFFAGIIGVAYLAATGRLDAAIAAISTGATTAKGAVTKK